MTFKQKSISSTVLAFVAGAAAGAAVSMFFAPRRGQEVRGRIKEKFLRASSGVQHKMNEQKEDIADHIEQAAETAERAAQKSKEVAQEAQTRARQSRTSSNKET